MQTPPDPNLPGAEILEFVQAAIKLVNSQGGILTALITVIIFLFGGKAPFIRTVAKAALAQGEAQEKKKTGEMAPVKLDSTIVALEKRIDVIEKDVIGVNRRLFGFDERFNSVDERFNVFGDRFTSIERAQEQMQNLIKSLPKG